MKPDKTDAAVARCIFAFITIIIAFVAAYVAHYQLGFADHDIRNAALTGACVAGTFLAVEYFSSKVRRPK